VLVVLFSKEGIHMSQNKIQSLLVTHLLKHGQIEIKLPDGVILEIGVTQLTENGQLIKKDDYCWIIASRENRSASMDSYNMGLRFEDDKDIIVFEDRFVDQKGETVRRLDVV
jgi:hypothetical protein